MKKITNYVVAVIVLLGALLFSYLVINVNTNTFIEASSNDFTFYFIVILSFGLSLVIAPTVHELGHLVFGKMGGMTFNSMKILGLCIYRCDDKLKFANAKKIQYAGSCEMMPTSTENVRKSYLLLSIGGLVFSFTLFVVELLLAFLLPQALPRDLWWLHLFLSMGLPYSFYLFFFNLVPMEIEGARNDGAEALSILRREHSSIVGINNLLIQAELYSGLTPSEIDRDLYFKVPQLREDDLQFAVITSLRVMYYLDLNDYTRCEKHIGRMKDILEMLPDEYVRNVAGELTYFEGSVKKDAEAAEKYYEMASEYLDLNVNVTTCRIKAAYQLYVKRDYYAAKDLIEQARALAETYYIKGIALFEVKLLDKLEADLSLLSEKIVDYELKQAPSSDVSEDAEVAADTEDAEDEQSDLVAENAQAENDAKDEK